MTRNPIYSPIIQLINSKNDYFLYNKLMYCQTCRDTFAKEQSIGIHSNDNEHQHLDKASHYIFDVTRL
jgi:hypothetical protein